MASPNSHAILSPSSSHRWLNCPPSARLETQFEDQESEAARQGTAAHALGEHKLLRALKRQSIRPVSEYDDEEMELLTDAYRDYVLEIYEQEKLKHPETEVYTEVPLNLRDYIPEGKGTSDAVIVSDNCLYVIDLKYGQGVLVDPENNSQLMIYALGAYQQFHTLYEFETISMSIFQPRRENVSTWTISLSQLLEWAADVLVPTATLAFDGDGEFKAGSWCLFCKAAQRCRARAEAQLKLAQLEFAKPPLLTDEEIEEILGKLDSLIKWAGEIQNYALSAAINQGKTWKGYKLVEGRSVRKYTDEKAVADAAIAAGYKDIYKKSLLTITEMEKLMTKKTFNEVLGSLVYKPPGKLTLAPENDKRKAVTVKNSAKDEFISQEEK